MRIVLLLHVTIILIIFTSSSQVKKLKTIILKNILQHFFHFKAMGIGADMIGEDETDMFLKISKHRFGGKWPITGTKATKKNFHKKMFISVSRRVAKFSAKGEPFLRQGLILKWTKTEKYKDTLFKGDSNGYKLEHWWHSLK